MATKQIYILEAAIGVVKIGCSYWPAKRAAMVSAHSPSPVRLIAIIEGGGRDERAFHQRFKAHRSHNEWFRLQGDVFDFVEGVRGAGIDRIPSWEECDRSPLHDRVELLREQQSEKAKAFWASPKGQAQLAERKRQRNVIEAFGGYAKLASVLEGPPGTTSAWKTRGSIPARYWSKIVEKATELGIEGVTFDALGRIAAQREVA